MSEPRILIAGVGNIFFGDDAFGVEVARRLMAKTLPHGVRVIDFGIRGLDLTYALLEDYDAVILVDAVPRGEPPGTLYVLDLADEFDDNDAGFAPQVDPHTLDPARVLALVKELGGDPRRVYLVGCEPEPIDPDDLEMELSEPVRAAIDEAVLLIEELVEKSLTGPGAPGLEETCGKEG